MNTIAIVSAFISTCSAIVALLSLYEQRRISKLSANLEFLTQTQKMLLDNPKLLSLHNITTEMLKECELNYEEFIYVLNTLYAGQVYYFVEKKKNIDLSKYRKNILNNKKVKIAWKKIIRETMIIDSPFVAAIDEYYGIKGCNSIF